jgi:hypothetical protein
MISDMWVCPLMEAVINLKWCAMKYIESWFVGSHGKDFET